MPGYGYVSSMFAFGLEECGAYERAEELAMGALHLDPRDAWALHAAVHCAEMTGRREDGVRLLREGEADWTASNLFAGHLHWHWALFSLEDGVSGYKAAMSRCVEEREGVFLFCPYLF